MHILNTIAASISLGAKNAAAGSCLRKQNPCGLFDFPAVRLLVVLSTAAALAGCTKTPVEASVNGGNSEKGISLIQKFGCGTCHTIPGIANADGQVGPPLNAIGQRVYIAGMLRNTPDNMTRWLRDPQAVVPGNAMPNMGLSEAQARNVAAYLYTLN